MRMRAKVLSVATAMVTAFAVLPTFGAAAAEPLDDDSYAVTIGEETHTFEVVDGTPVIEDVEGVEFTFEFDEETGRVLDEFDVAVDGTTYEVEVADDGTVRVTADDTDNEASDDEGDGEVSDDEDEDTDETSDDEPVDETESLDEEDNEDEDEAEEDGEHGELVSTVAQCAPAGREAREAGLPNHGFFVSAAARGETVDLEVDGETHTADLTSLEGAEEFCTLAEQLLEDAAEPEVEDDEDADDEQRGGPPAHAGRPDHAGPPAHAGPPGRDADDA